MRHLSIKLKVTLWYTFLMVVVVSAVLAFMYLISSSVIEKDVKNELEAVVDSIGGTLRLDDHELIINVNLVQNGIYTVIYKEDLSPLQGFFPLEYDNTNVEYKSDVLQTLKINGLNFYVYDRKIDLQDEDEKTSVWIRGVVASDTTPNLMKNLFQIALMTLPFLVLLAAIGGYLISRQAFKPIDRLMRAANEISDGKDLSKRIGLENSKDEIGRLANTFDRMFNRLENSFEAEKQFTSDASHELRTPITVILAQSELAQSSAKTLEDHQEALGVIHRQALKISHLITQLLAFARLDQNHGKPEFTQIDLSDLAQSVCDEQKEAWQSSITLTYEIQPKVKALGDPVLLNRLMSNLIENAYQYGKENGKINVSLSQNQKEILFTVEDDGIGISQSNQEKIFKRFYQVSNSRTANERGSMGLGLAMVQKIALLHNGSISVESTLNKGSRFIFKFPK
jgi:signal transduction histidine kinase